MVNTTTKKIRTVLIWSDAEIAVIEIDTDFNSCEIFQGNKSISQWPQLVIADLRQKKAAHELKTVEKHPYVVRIDGFFFFFTV